MDHSIPGAGDPPSESVVLGFMESLSNWGRWGLDDQLGTLNLITAERRIAAARLVTQGTSVGCARSVEIEPGASDVLIPPSHYMIGSGEARNNASERASTASDVIGIASHGVTVTHVDALSHFFWDDRMYNGRSAQLVSTRGGATVGSVEPMRDGIVTRGVLLDVAALLGKPYMSEGDAIHPELLEACEREHGVEIGEGDALLLRTGWAQRRIELGPYPIRKHRPGLHASTLPWLRDRGVAVIAADAAHDVIPSGYEVMPMPVHTVGIVAMGLCLIDNCEFEALAEVCRRLKRWELMFAIAPLRFLGATASPVTPLAIL